MSGFTNETFEVLAELEQNNNKAWYDANKDRLNTVARAPFAGMLGIVTALLEGSSTPMQGSAKSMFRQYRDVRFSKDKTPYKATVSGLLTASGDKKDGGGVVYAQIEPGGGFVGAGFHNLPTAELSLIRDRIIAEPEVFAEIRSGLEAKGLPLKFDNTLSSMPRGYAQHADHPQADALKLKSFLVSEEQHKSVWISGDIVERMVAVSEAVGPLLRFGRGALAGQS